MQVASFLETWSFRDVRSSVIGQRMAWRWWGCRAQSPELWRAGGGWGVTGSLTGRSHAGS
eukprot:scaffold218598_cov17-Tisochrysis_lutea.AAC.1